MARAAKKQNKLTPEEKLAQALVPEAEWPYQVPENWCWVKLGALAIEIADGPFGSNLKKDHYTNNREARIIQLSNIGEDGWKEENTKYTTFTHAKEISRSIVEPGSIVIAKMMPAGRAIICPNNEAMYVLSSDAVKFVPAKPLNTKFLALAINAPSFRNQIQENTRGITRARTSIGKLREGNLALPPLAEQQRIVDCIESLFAKLDEAKEKAQAVVDGFEDRKAAILHKAFIGDLTIRWRKTNSVFFSSWQYIALEKLCDRIFDGPFGSNLKTNDYVENGVRVVRLENLKNLWFDDSKQSFVSKEKYETISNHTVFPTDLIMSTFIVDEVKICQMPSYIKYAVNKADCIGIRLKPNVISSYILYFLSSREAFNSLKRGIHGATRPRVNTKQIKSIVIPVPEQKEQVAIVHILDRLIANGQQAKESAEQVIAQIDAMKKSILARAFRGELGTNDPDDESAVELLKNIIL